MTFKINSSIKYKEWRQDMENFRFSPDGISLIPRAGFEINQQCPKEYRMIILECISNGWLKPVGYQPVEEHFLEKLSA